MNQNPQVQNSSARLAWYLYGKFGLFIHWGTYAAAGVEASWPIMAPDAEAIFGSTYTALQGLPWGLVTRKGDKLFFHITRWPTDHRLVINPFPFVLRSISLFSGEPLAFTHSGAQLEITLPPLAPDPDVSVLVGNLQDSEESWR
jgi:hypothetical protein